MNIELNIRQIRTTIPNGVQMVCVSKYHTKEDITKAYKYGERVFAESRAQELLIKAQTLPKDIEWHFIGHLQSNKVKSVCQWVSMIQSVDSIKLINTINSYADHVIDVLLEVHIANEESKSGFEERQLIDFLATDDWKQLNKIRIRGLMGMATNTNDVNLIRQEFRKLKVLFEQVKKDYFSNNLYFDTLSMGMSDDYQIAIAEGATMVRIGSKIFGNHQ